MRSEGDALVFKEHLAIGVIARCTRKDRDSMLVFRSVRRVGVGSAGDSPRQPNPRHSEVPTSAKAHAVCPKIPTIELPAPAV